jgi:hypothetical protein
VRSEKLPKFLSGTLVRHYSYKLTNLHGKLGPGTGNLYHLSALICIRRFSIHCSHSVSMICKVREMLDSRYDDIKSGKVKLIPGDEVLARLRAKSAACRSRRS